MLTEIGIVVLEAAILAAFIATVALVAGVCTGVL